MPKRKRKSPPSRALTQTCPPHAVRLAVGETAHLPGGQAQVDQGRPPAVGEGELVAAGQAHNKIQAVVSEPLKPLLAHELTVPQHQPDAVFAQQLPADLQQGNAVAGIGIAAAVVEQLPGERPGERAPAHAHEQDIDLTLPEVPLRAVQAQAQLALGRQQARQQARQHLGQDQITQIHFAEKVLNARRVRGRLHGLVQVLGDGRKLDVAAVEQGPNKLTDKLLTSQVAHDGRGLKKRRNFGAEALLHGAERVWWRWNPKGRTAPFSCPQF